MPLQPRAIVTAATLTPIVMGLAIAVATPRVGFVPAVRLVGVSTAALGGISGIVCLLLLSSAPPIRLGHGSD